MHKFDILSHINEPKDLKLLPNLIWINYALNFVSL